MIGMNFVAFATLFVISVIVASVVHYVLQYRLRAGVEGSWPRSSRGGLGVGWGRRCLVTGQPPGSLSRCMWRRPCSDLSWRCFGAVFALRTLSSLVGVSPSAGGESERHLLRDAA